MMGFILLTLALLLFIGTVFLLINAVIAPDWLDWAQFTCFTMLWPLGLHLEYRTSLILFWIVTGVAVIADVISFYRVRKRGGKTEKHLRRLWLTLLVALVFLIISVFSEALVGV